MISNLLSDIANGDRLLIINFIPRANTDKAYFKKSMYEIGLAPQFIQNNCQVMDTAVCILKGQQYENSSKLENDVLPRLRAIAFTAQLIMSCPIDENTAEDVESYITASSSAQQEMVLLLQTLLSQ